GEGIDPVLDFNTKLWNAVPNHLSDEEKKNHPYRKQASAQGRKNNYRANFYIIDDTVNSDNSGKAVKFKFGKWCFDLLENAQYPSELQLKRGIKGFDPYNIFNAPNFEIEIFTDQSKKVDGKAQRNYSKSHFVSTFGPLASEKEMEDIYNSISGWSLRDYLAPDKFKTYEELKRRLDETVGFDTALWKPNTKNTTYSIPSEKAKESPAIQNKEPEVEDTVASDSQDFFANLVEDKIPF
ncbi:MAG: hypothetical protein ACYDBV_14330, partial [Nitrospiria bacterium]